MDVLLVRVSPFTLPSQRRVGAIVHEGAADLRLWPGRGPDSDLREAWGEGLQEALEAERRRLGDAPVPLFQPVRIPPGRLHCDFLLWVPARGPEPGTTREPAPDAEGIARAVDAALGFAAERDVERVALPALGWGPGELPVGERLEQVVRAAHAYGEGRYRGGKPPVIEQVLVCEAQASVMRELEGRVGSLVRGTVEAVRPAKESAPKAPRRGAGKGGGRRPKKPALDPDELAQARVSAAPYDMRHTYAPGEWLSHAKFGVGRVEEATPEGAILVLFESGDKRKLVHGR